MKVRMILSCCVLLPTLSGCVGCSTIDRVLEQFDEAINEVRLLRVSLVDQSREWQDVVNGSQSKFTKEIRLMIREDFPDAADEVVKSVGIQGMCTIDFVESKLLTYLKALEDALIETRKQLEVTKDAAGLTPEAVIARIIEERGHIAPHVCSTRPSTGEIKLLIEDGSTDNYKPFSDEGKFEVYGFALKRAKDDAKQYRLFVNGADGKSRSIDDLTEIIQTNSPYQLTMFVEEIAKHIKSSDRSLDLFCGDELVVNVKLRFPPAPQSPSKSVYVRITKIDIYNRGYNKDRWNCTLSLTTSGVRRDVKWTLERVKDNLDGKGRAPDGQDTHFSSYVPSPFLTDPLRVNADQNLIVKMSGFADLMPDSRKSNEDKLRNAEKWIKHYSVGVQGIGQKIGYEHKAKNYRRTLTTETFSSAPMVFKAHDSFGIRGGTQEGANYGLMTLIKQGAKPNEQPQAIVYFKIEEADELSE